MSTLEISPGFDTDREQMSKRDVRTQLGGFGKYSVVLEGCVFYS